MFRREPCGQEAIEFILITVLVFFGALFTIIAFGDKLSSFFTSGTSVHKVSGAKVTALTAENVPSFNSNYETFVDIPRPVIVETQPSDIEGMEVIDVDGIKIQVPTDLSNVIQTTGSSGGTEQITDSIKALVAQLKSIAEEDPTNTNLQNMVSVATKLSESGYLVSDAEEWFELAAQRLTSNDKIDVPKDNLLCEDGGYYGEEAYCDKDIVNNQFLYSDAAALSTNLNREVGSFKGLKEELNSLDSNVTDERINNIVSSIGLLSDEVVDISNNVKYQADPVRKEVTSLKDLNAGVASKTTNIKAAMIAFFKEKMRQKDAATVIEPSTNEASAITTKTTN